MGSFPVLPAESAPDERKFVLRSWDAKHYGFLRSFDTGHLQYVYKDCLNSPLKIRF
jgi:hypothetical protein